MTWTLVYRLGLKIHLRRRLRHERGRRREDRRLRRIEWVEDRSEV